MVPDAALFTGYHGTETDIGYAVEDVCLDLRVCLLQGSDQLFISSRPEEVAPTSWQAVQVSALILICINP